MIYASPDYNDFWQVAEYCQWQIWFYHKASSRVYIDVEYILN